MNSFSHSAQSAHLRTEATLPVLLLSLTSATSGHSACITLLRPLRPREPSTWSSLPTTELANSFPLLRLSSKVPSAPAHLTLTGLQVPSSSDRTGGSSLGTFSLSLNSELTSQRPSLRPSVPPRRVSTLPISPQCHTLRPGATSLSLCLCAQPLLREPRSHPGGEPPSHLLRCARNWAVLSDAQ